MPELNLEDIRVGLDTCGERMLEIFARRFKQHKKKWEETVEMGTKKEDFVVNFYHAIAGGLAEEKYRKKIKQIGADDFAVKRIIEGLDFADDEAKDTSLSDENFRRLLFFFDYSDTELVQVLQDRYRWVEQISLFKKSRKIAIRKPERENELIERTERRCQELGLPPGLGSLVYKQLIFPVAFQIEELMIGSPDI